MRSMILAIALAALSYGAGTIMSAQSGGNTAAQNKALIEAGLKAWADGTGSPYDLLADEATWTIVGRSASAKTYRGREAFMREVIRPFNARMKTPLRPQIRRIFTDGDTVIAFLDASGTANDGKPYSNTYAWFLEMRDGRIVVAHAFFDSIAFNELWTRVAPANSK